jgi:hypothetical protein
MSYLNANRKSSEKIKVEFLEQKPVLFLFSLVFAIFHIYIYGRKTNFSLIQANLAAD